MKIFEKSLFAVTFVVAFLGIIKLAPTVISAFLSFAICIYLFAGWYLLFPNKMIGTMRWIPFIVSYLTAQTLLALLFGINDWPMRLILSYFTIILLLITIGFFVFFRKYLSANYPFGEYLLRLIICFMFSGAPVWM